MSLRFAYNTNGLSHHRLSDALELLAELGYEGVAITPDPGHLDPYAADARAAGPDARAAGEVRARARDLGLALTVETGSRYLLDSRRKHFPTLLEPEERDRARRVDFLRRCVDLAAELGAEAVSLWAGAAPGGVAGDDGAGPEELWERLASGVARVLEHAAGSGVAVAFEPEPGMFLERPAGYEELVRRLGARGDELRLCLDVGHCVVTGDAVPEVVRRHAERLAVVHLDDAVRGVHEHVMFGRGELDLPATLRALEDARFAGLAAVELSRDAHRGAAAAEEALRHLRRALAAREND